MFLAAVLIGYIFYRWPPATFIDVLTTIAPVYLAAACLLMPVKVWFEFRRWLLLIRLADPTCKLSTVFASMLVGVAGGVVTPGSLGEHARIAPFANAGRLRALSLSIFDGIAWAGVATLIAAAALICLPLDLYLQRGGVEQWATAGVLIGAGVTIVWECLLMAMVFSPRRVTALLARVPWIARRKTFQEMRSALALVGRWQRLHLVALAAGTFGVYLLQFDLIMRGLGFAHHLTWAGAAVSALIRRMLPFTAGGIGVNEVSAAELLMPLGAQPQIAITGAMALFLINRVSLALCGGLLLTFRKRSPLGTPTS